MFLEGKSLMRPPLAGCHGHSFDLRHPSNRLNGEIFRLPPVRSQLKRWLKMRSPRAEALYREPFKSLPSEIARKIQLRNRSSSVTSKLKTRAQNQNPSVWNHFFIRRIKVTNNEWTLIAPSLPSYASSDIARITSWPPPLKSQSKTKLFDTVIMALPFSLDDFEEILYLTIHHQCLLTTQWLSPNSMPIVQIRTPLSPSSQWITPNCRQHRQIILLIILH